VTSARTILCVEDNPITRKMLRLTLETENYAVVEAGDGQSALRFARQRMPDGVLQDIVLPDIDGFELVRCLKTLPGGPETPIVALSGFLGRIEEARAAQAGFAALLVKPIEPSRLLECLRAYFPRPLGAELAVGDGRRIVLVDDDPIQLKLTRIQLCQLGFDVVAVTTAEEAIERSRTVVPHAIVSDVLMPHVDGFELCIRVRRDSALAGVPVVLASAWYQTDTDRRLAARVGANALALRTPDLGDLVDAILRALNQGVPPRGIEPELHLRLDHATAVVQQLERQLSVSSGLARRCALQAAQISLLSGVASALAAQRDLGAALRDVLAATLDAAGISKGALFLKAPNGDIILRESVGFEDTGIDVLADCFGCRATLEGLIEQQTCVVVPSSSVAPEVSNALLSGAKAVSAQIISLVSEGRGVGAMVLAAATTDVTSEDSMAFARAMGNQLAQSLELAASFARLAASERRYRTLTENAHDAIAILTPGGLIREVNIRMERLLGRSRRELVGRNIREFVSSAGGGEDVASLEDPLGAESGATRALALETACGTTVLMEFSIAELDVSEERLVFAIGRDVTEQVHAQTQLMVADRMASVGMMAAGVAHEINNPLAAVGMNLQLALDDLDTLVASPAQRGHLARLEEELSDAREATGRVRDIVQDLKVFSRQEEDQLGPVDVQRIIDSSLRMARNEIRHRAQVVKDYAPVPPVLANESRLGQVFLNLVVNAAQAIPEGHADANEIRVRIRSAEAGGAVLVEVADTGPGIPPQTLSKLFTPFFTTKPAGVGTGLGLAICQRIVTGFGGEITVRPAPGGGAIFAVKIPTAELSEHEVFLHSSPSTSVRRGRVLVVDDEVIVGTAIGRLLESEHDIEFLTTAAAALDRIHGGDRFDVILCDVMMPVKGGLELYEELRREVPEQARRVIFLTGGAFTPRARRFLDGIVNARLEKPFEKQTLRALVNERVRSSTAR
jgi:PAS domain S-box-containing protein